MMQGWITAHHNSFLRYSQVVRTRYLQQENHIDTGGLIPTLIGWVESAVEEVSHGEDVDCTVPLGVQGVCVQSRLQGEEGGKYLG